MQIITTIPELRKVIAGEKAAGKTVGLVPTMGYLHEGHLTLIRTAKQACDVAVASIFVNPIQFGPKEDYAVYPRDLERDSSLAAQAGIDYIFAPSVTEMYPDGHTNVKTFVEVVDLTDKLCGATRPGHFRGVTTVVSKLFNIVQPDRAYFGQKDAQQVTVIKKMVEDLNMNLEIVTVPIVREEDGLAMSSRNMYLSTQERQAALVLSQALALAKRMLDGGQHDAQIIRTSMVEYIQKEPLAQIDYAEISDSKTLEPVVSIISSPILLALAVRIGKTRLIDNMVWGDVYV